MPYDLTKPEDRAEILRCTAAAAVDVFADGHEAVASAISAKAALRDALAAGYVLVPPVNDETVENVAEFIWNWGGDKGQWGQASEDRRDYFRDVARPLIAITRGEKP